MHLEEEELGIGRIVGEGLARTGHPSFLAFAEGRRSEDEACFRQEGLEEGSPWDRAHQAGDNPLGHRSTLAHQACHRVGCRECPQLAKGMRTKSVNRKRGGREIDGEIRTSC